MRLTSETIKSLHESRAIVSASAPRPAFRQATQTTLSTHPSVRPASERAIAYMRSLVAERYPQATEAYVQSIIDQGATRVSKAIDSLKLLPKAPRLNRRIEVAEGRYALRDDEGVIHFYWVKRDGIYAQASDDFHRITSGSRQSEIIEAIKADPKAAAILYGTELGVCGRCGRTLTDEDSRARGIGPTCSAQEGWL